MVFIEISYEINVLKFFPKKWIKIIKKLNYISEF